jgi:hypothetical protein
VEYVRSRRKNAATSQYIINRFIMLMTYPRSAIVHVVKMIDRGDDHRI